MTTETIHTTTPSGKPIILSANIYLNKADLVSAELPTLGIKGGAGCFGRMPLAKDGACYSFRLFGKTDRMIGLTEAEGRRVEACLAALQSTHDASRDGAAAILRRRRQEIVDRLAAARELGTEGRSRAWESGDEQGGVTANRHDGEANRIAMELEAFDLEHPEIIAEIRQQKSADAAAAALR